MRQSDFHRLASCEGKARFASFEFAEKVKARMRTKKSERGLHVYRCHHCRCFHVGRSSRA